MFKFYGQKTVIWYSVTTGRKMVPRTRPFHTILTSADQQSAIEEARRLADATVTLDQKRDVVISGTIYEIGTGGMVLSECKI